MPKPATFVALDVGEKRIGVAVGDDSVRIAVPFETIDVDGSEVEAIAEIMVREGARTVVVGYPRNQSGEPTPQTEYVVEFADKLKDIVENIVYQDESLTSVIAEKRLESYNKPYKKSEIDAQAAAIILQDYLEQLP